MVDSVLMEMCVPASQQAGDFRAAAPAICLLQQLLLLLLLHAIDIKAGCRFTTACFCTYCWKWSTRFCIE